MGAIYIDLHYIRLCPCAYVQTRGLSFVEGQTGGVWGGGVREVLRDYGGGSRAGPPAPFKNKHSKRKQELNARSHNAARDAEERQTVGERARG